MIAEAVGKTDEQIEAEISSVNELRKFVLAEYPKLNNFNFKIAVNHNIVAEDFLLSDNEEIALLPPFAGG